MPLAREIYSAADLMPKREEYRLTSQMIRAAISIPANIAEGHARSTRRDYAHFISIARGSTAELETLIMFASDTELLRKAKTSELLASAEEVGRMLRLHERLKETP
jgi:four helix bundle protein